MSVDFSQIVKQAYQGAEDFQVKDSQVREHITKVKAAVTMILERFTRYNAQFFGQKSREWQTELSEAQKKIADSTRTAASTVFYLSGGVADAMKDLEKSVFTPEECEWLAEEAASILAYLAEIQTVCKSHLEGFDQEAVDAKVQVFKEGMEKLKPWIPEVPVKLSTKKEVALPAELETSDLVALSPRLQSLEENQTRLMTLKQSAEEMCAQLDAWKQAVESGLPFEGEVPSSDAFQALVREVEALSFQEVVIPKGLLAKISLCSKVAGRALEQISAISARFSNGLLDSQNDVLYALRAHQQWQNLSVREHLPSPGGFIEDLNPDSSIRAQLEAVSWLHTLPQAQLNNLERSFAVLSQGEQVEFKKLLDDSTNISEFLQKLEDLYNEKLAGLTQEKGTLEAQVEELREAVSAGAQSQTELENLRKELSDREGELSNQNVRVRELEEQQNRQLSENRRSQSQAEVQPYKLGYLYREKWLDMCERKWLKRCERTGSIEGLLEITCRRYWFEAIYERKGELGWPEVEKLYLEPEVCSII